MRGGFGFWDRFKLPFDLCWLSRPWTGLGVVVLVRRSAVAFPLLSSRRAPHALLGRQFNGLGSRCLLVSTVGTDLRPGQLAAAGLAATEGHGM